MSESRDNKIPDNLPEVSPDAPALPEGWLEVLSMDMDAQGVARKPDGKVVFIDGALTGEIVSANIHRKKNNWEAGTLTEIHRESSQRVTPGCPNFGLHVGACGGCKMQHLHVAAQVAIKQRVLEDNLWHLGKVKPETLMRPIEGPAWGYRYRSRLSVRYVIKKGKALVGFHERKSRYIAPCGRDADAHARADCQHGCARDLPADRSGLRRPCDSAGVASSGAAERGRQAAPARLCC